MTGKSKTPVTAIAGALIPAVLAAGIASPVMAHTGVLLLI